MSPPQGVGIVGRALTLASGGAVALCVACSSVQTPPTPSRSVPVATIAATPSPSFLPWVSPDCAATHFASSGAGAPEAQGIAPAPNTLWTLVFDSVPVPEGQDVKIVYRMTGSGTLPLMADGPGGLQVAPDWEEMHTGSNWTTHPGDEWGAGFTFNRPSCWEIFAARGSLLGRIGIPVQ